MFVSGVHVCVFKIMYCCAFSYEYYYEQTNYTGYPSLTLMHSYVFLYESWILIMIKQIIGYRSIDVATCQVWVLAWTVDSFGHILCTSCIGKKIIFLYNSIICYFRTMREDFIITLLCAGTTFLEQMYLIVRWMIDLLYLRWNTT